MKQINIINQFFPLFLLFQYYIHSLYYIRTFLFKIQEKEAKLYLQSYFDFPIQIDKIKIYQTFNNKSIKPLASTEFQFIVNKKTLFDLDPQDALDANALDSNIPVSSVPQKPGEYYILSASQNEILNLNYIKARSVTIKAYAKISKAEKYDTSLLDVIQPVLINQRIQNLQNNLDIEQQNLIEFIQKAQQFNQQFQIFQSSKIDEFHQYQQFGCNYYQTLITKLQFALQDIQSQNQVLDNIGSKYVSQEPTLYSTFLPKVTGNIRVENKLSQNQRLENIFKKFVQDLEQGNFQTQDNQNTKQQQNTSITQQKSMMFSTLSQLDNYKQICQLQQNLFESASETVQILDFAKNVEKTLQSTKSVQTNVLLDSMRISLKEATGEQLKDEIQIPQSQSDDNEYEILSTDEEQEIEDIKQSRLNKSAIQPQEIQYKDVNQSQIQKTVQKQIVKLQKLKEPINNFTIDEKLYTQSFNTGSKFSFTKFTDFKNLIYIICRIEYQRSIKSITIKDQIYTFIGDPQICFYSTRSTLYCIFTLNKNLYFIDFNQMKYKKIDSIAIDPLSICGDNCRFTRSSWQINNKKIVNLNYKLYSLNINLFEIN